MTKLGSNLVNLAQTMPDKMEGFAKTIEAVQEGEGKTDDVNEEIAKTDAAVPTATNTSVLNDSNAVTQGQDEEDEDEDAEDMFAQMVGR